LRTRTLINLNTLISPTWWWLVFKKIGSII
jgi:hypothetical protein